MADAFGGNSTASEPMDISLDGYNGRSITLQAPAIFAHDCDREQMAIFASEDRSPDRYLERGGPDGDGMQGQFDELWILDVNGRIVVLDLAYDRGTPRTPWTSSEASWPRLHSTCPDRSGRDRCAGGPRRPPAFSSQSSGFKRLALRRRPSQSRRHHLRPLLMATHIEPRVAL